MVMGLTTVRGCGRPVAFDVDFVAVTAGALTVVAVRVCLFGALTVVTFFAGVPPVLDFVVALDPLVDVERDALELDLLELDPPPVRLAPADPLEPPPLELDPLDEPPPPPVPPAPADPVPERRAIILAPSFFFES